MAEIGPYTPHETRMLALEMAVEFVNGDGRKSAKWTTGEVVDIARKFEVYLTGAPVAGFVPGVAVDGEV